MTEPKKSSIETLADKFIEYCIDDDQSKWTIPTKRTHLKQFGSYCAAQNISITDLTTSGIKDYFHWYRRGREISTVNSARATVRAFLKWATEYDSAIQLKFKPDAIKFAEEPQSLPKSLPRGVIMNAIAVTTDPHDALMIETCWRAGLRISEMIGIRERDVVGDEIRVTGKGSRDRIVYITNSLADRLEGLKTGQPEVQLFRNNTIHGRGRPITTKAARNHIQAAFESIGIDMNPHHLRHSFGVELLTNGCDIVSIQTMMGHKYVTTTQVYLKLCNQYVKGQYKRYMI